MIIGLLLIALFQLFQSPGQRPASNDIAFSEFLREVEQDNVRDVTIMDQAITGRYQNGSTFQTSISLPKGWKFTRKAKSRSTARASFWFLKRDRPATGVRFKGREVRVTYRYPDGDASWPGEQGPEPFYDQLTFRIELKRGAIVRTRNAAVGRSFKVRGRISPTPALRWYGPTQASKTVRAR